METDREAGKAQTGRKTMQFSGGEGQGSEGLVGAVTEKVEEGDLAEPDTKLQQRSEGRSLLHCRELGVGDECPGSQPFFQRSFYTRFLLTPSCLLRGKFPFLLQFCTLKRNRSKI